MSGVRMVAKVEIKALEYLLNEGMVSIQGGNVQVNEGTGKPLA